MNVTREIVKDLLPLYVAGEACEDSRAAVEEWLRTDPELARLAAALADDAAPPLTAGMPQASAKAALASTKALLHRRAWLMAVALMFTFLPASFEVEDGILRFSMLRDDPLLSAISLAIALCLWIAFARVVRRLRVTGL